MAGLIGIPCSDTGRFSAFSESLANMRKPPGCEVRRVLSSWRHYSRNELAQMTLMNNLDWLLMIDDDHTFGSDLLDRLLACSVPVVAALALQRAEPYGPFCFTHEEPEGVYHPISLGAMRPGLVEVAAVGTGAMLVRRRVFEQLPAPWFTVTSDEGEDMRFCRSLREAGIPIHCDLSTPIGHLTTACVKPVLTRDGWKVGLEVSEETRVVRELPEPAPLTA